jgi:hypothetical protein
MKDEEHIIRCQIATRQFVRDKWRKEVTKYLSENHTPKAIKDATCHGFYPWLESGRNTQDIPPPPIRQMEVMKVYELQSTIGWNHFVHGQMAIEWGRLINDHLRTRRDYSFNAEHCGAKLLAINWNHMLKL